MYHLSYNIGNNWTNEQRMEYDNNVLSIIELLDQYWSLIIKPIHEINHIISNMPLYHVVVLDEINRKSGK